MFPLIVDALCLFQHEVKCKAIPAKFKLEDCDEYELYDEDDFEKAEDVIRKEKHV